MKTRTLIALIFLIVQIEFLCFALLNQNINSANLKLWDAQIKLDRSLIDTEATTTMWCVYQDKQTIKTITPTVVTVKKPTTVVSQPKHLETTPTQTLAPLLVEPSKQVEMPKAQAVTQQSTTTEKATAQEPLCIVTLNHPCGY